MQTVAARRAAIHELHLEPRDRFRRFIPPTHAEIAERAYDIYEKSGRREGQSFFNWMEAERLLCRFGRSDVRA